MPTPSDDRPDLVTVFAWMRAAAGKEDVLLEVSEPRFPCWKLGVRFGDPRMLKRFAAARRPGAYLRIVEEGRLEAGDSVERVSRPDHDLSIEAFAHAYLSDHSQLPRLLIPEVSEDWQQWVRERAA